MSVKLIPDPVDFLRELEALRVRSKAANIRQRPHADEDIDPPQHETNGEIEKFHPQVPTSFSKGLPHNKYGIVDADAFGEFVEFINQPRTRPNLFRYSDTTGEDVPLGPDGGLQPFNEKMRPGMPGTPTEKRAWESPLAGHVYSLMGADADMITMPPAPALGSGELSFEMAEVYAFALLRDVPFTKITAGTGKATDPIKALGAFKWLGKSQSDDKTEARRRARLDENGDFTAQVALRGSTGGARKGPYLSQFMLVGSTPLSTTENLSAAHLVCPIQIEDGGIFRSANPRDGYITYGTQQIDQRGARHAPTLAGDKDHVGDYMTDWASWIDVQNGADFRGKDAYADGKRFITTPRDLATYVHFDQLYQAYLNACLLLLSYKYPFDSGMPENTRTVRDSGGQEIIARRAAFATFGGPHLLSLVTEVASRALKFARRQKYNIHLRARPEVVASVLTLALHAEAKSSDKYAKQLGKKAAKAAQKALGHFEHAAHESGIDILDRITAHNSKINAAKGYKKSDHPNDWIDPDCNALLPMAFPEGSPMHPSYAAGHATVAGACVTILKAFFEMYDPLPKGETPDPENADHWKEREFIGLYGKNKSDRKKTLDLPTFTTGIFAPDEDGKDLVQQDGSSNEGLTVLGELDKLAANIAIGRDMAGVHYYTDYYESLRMGERVAVSMLQEQMLTYPETVTMRLTTFDGERMIIRGQGDGANAKVEIFDPEEGKDVSFRDWFQR